MFTAFGKTAMCLIVLHTLVSLFKAWRWAPSALRAGCNSPHRESRRHYQRVAKDEDLLAAFLWRTTWSNFGYRHWLVSDFRTAFILWSSGSKLKLKDSVFSRIRAVAVAQFLLCTMLAAMVGAASWEALGIGAVNGVVLFAFGAVGVYTGRLSATVGDKRILGI